jgi:octaprenyl-diphosphate synthase
VESAAKSFVERHADSHNVENKIREILAGAGPLSPIVDYVVNSGGKRLRPSLVLWTTKACANTFQTSFSDEEATEVAVAFELAHQASLIHDDIIDGANIRRGRPTVHLLWGIHSAVLAGDYLFTMANRVALRYGRLGIASLINQAIELTCEGEVAQDARLWDAAVSEADYLSHISKKTAALIGAASQAGAILAGSPSFAEEAMLRFGIELGSAFQIADDIMDIQSEVSVSGKEPGNDLRRGLLTLPLILAMDGPVGELVRRALSAREVTDETVDSVKRLLNVHGYIVRARKKAISLTQSAESRLSFLVPCPAKDALISTLRNVPHRLA